MSPSEQNVARGRIDSDSPLHGEVSSEKNGEDWTSRLPFDPLRLLMGVARRWVWLLLAALLFGGGALVAGILTFETSYKASIYLIRRELLNSFQVNLKIWCANVLFIY